MADTKKTPPQSPPSRQITPTAPAQHGAGAIAPPQAAPKKTPQQILSEAILARRDAFAEVSTKWLPAERLVKLAQVMLSKTPDLARCPTMQVLTELMNCARLGLEPNVEGGRWLVPFKDKGGMALVGITDYRGLIDVARRSGEVVAIHADVVRQNDTWEFWIDAGGDTLVHLVHRRAEGGAEDRGEIRGAYAVVKLKSGEVQAEYLTLEQINGSRDRSRGSDSSFSPWNKDWEAMAKKTAVRRLYNFLPKTPEIAAARAVLTDEDAADRKTTTVEVVESGARSLAERVAEGAQALMGPGSQTVPAGEPTPTASQDQGPRCEVCSRLLPLNADGLCGDCAMPGDAPEPGSDG